MPDVKVLEHSSTGKLYAIGDIHGMKNILDLAHSRLRPQDRLIIVGDLTDRGPESLQVIEGIAANNADPSKAKIYSIVGNHEDMVLKSIKELEAVAVALAAETQVVEEEKFLKCIKSNPTLAIHLDSVNGGKWLIDLFIDELFAKQNIHITSEDSIKHNIEYQSDSKIEKIKNYFKSLPYIIRVQGNEDNPAINFVHADMPVDDGALKTLISQNGHLFPAEIIHAIWARPSDFDASVKRNELSSLTTCGHNLLIREKALSVRSKTNTVNCDIGSFASNVGLLLNLTDGVAEAVGTVAQRYKKDVEKHLTLINEHLKNQKQLYIYYYAPYKHLKTFADLHKAITSDRPKAVTRTLTYLFNNDALTKFGIHTTDDLNDALQKINPRAKRTFFDSAPKAAPSSENTKRPKKP